ncbi:MAG: Crp/Fnr family transcriptional regulator [Deltaproteobacteria bacterium]|nr:Crp/Fnr family transcriptional regulator [Deltaproteobacteria bacterium]
MLTNVFIFSGLDDRALSFIERVSEERTYAEGEHVFREGDPPRWFPILLAGHVKLWKRAKGEREVILRIVHAGDVFGELATFSEHPYSASATTLSPARVLLIPHDAFLRLFREFPEIGFELMLDLAARLRLAHDVLHAMATDSVDRRVAKCLVRLAERAGNENGALVRFGFPIRRRDVAAISGTTVETAIRVLGDFRRHHWIGGGRRSLEIHDLGALKRFAEEGGMAAGRRGSKSRPANSAPVATHP